MSINPFSEVALFEQGNESDPFFATGSSPSLGDGTFSKHLRNKDQIRVSFPVKNFVKMPALTASIYYFDVANGQWRIPPEAASDLVDSPFDKFSFVTVGANFDSSVFHPSNKTNGSAVIEDEIGFDCYGNLIASGNLDTRRQKNGYIDGSYYAGSFNRTYSETSPSEQMSFLTLDCPKSVTRNSDYTPDKSQTFELPISSPFLIEKVVVEIPFLIGSSWFQDRTTTTIAVTNYAGDGGAYRHNLDGVDSGKKQVVFNMGGPRMSLALFSQKNYGTGSVRDIILHSAITPFSDSIPSLYARGYNQSYAVDDTWLVMPTGLEIASSTSHVTIVSGTRRSPGNPLDVRLSHTGSVTVSSDCSVTNGMKLLAYSQRYNAGDPTKNIVDFYTNLVSNKFLNQKITPTQLRFLSASPFGRAMTGFSPSGGSIFGGEHATSNQDLVNSRGQVRSPFYVEDASIRSQLISYVSNLFVAQPTWDCDFVSTLSLGSRKVSPYLVRPGEKLVLSISKHRPAITSFNSNVSTSNLNNGKLGIGEVSKAKTMINNLAGGISDTGHDVQLTTGSINITFYGSYVRSGGEYRP